jgi:hypothetical protein
LLTPLRDAVVELVVFRPAPLRIQVVGSSDPATLKLGGCIQDCPGGVCAACCGLALADVSTTGRVEVEDFYPDEYSEIFLAGDEVEIWRAAVRDLDLGGPPIVIEVPAGFGSMTEARPGARPQP